VIFLLIHIVYLNRNMLGTNKVAVVVVVVVVVGFHRSVSALITVGTLSAALAIIIFIITIINVIIIEMM